MVVYFAKMEIKEVINFIDGVDKLDCEVINYADRNGVWALLRELFYQAKDYEQIIGVLQLEEV